MKKIILSLAVLGICIAGNVQAISIHSFSQSCSGGGLLCWDVAANADPGGQPISAAYAEGSITVTVNESDLLPDVQAMLSGDALTIGQDIQLKESVCTALGAPAGTKIEAGTYSISKRKGKITITMTVTES